MRKESTIFLEDGGNKLEFKIMAMPATKGHEFLVRALLLLGSSGADYSGEASLEGAAGYLNSQGLKALSRIDFEQAKPLLGDLLSCCTRVNRESGGVVMQKLDSPGTIDSIISDPRTIFQLQVEAFKVNFGFFGQGGEEKSDSPEVLNMGKPGKVAG
jgi:hypothetical protein